MTAVYPSSMFRTLRSRLLLSYSLLVVVTLFVVSLALLALGAQPRLRFQPALQRLDIVSRASRNDVIRLQLSSTDQDSFLRDLLQTLEDTAESNNVRAFIATANNAQIIFDTDPSQSLVGVSIEGVELPADYLPTTDPNTLAARFEDPEGNRWLVYTALAQGADRLRFICLWNGGGGDGRGGTAHMVKEVARRTGQVTWLDTRALW